MKDFILFLLLVGIINISCNKDARISEEEFTLLINNYVEDLERKRWDIFVNNKGSSDPLKMLPLVDSIIYELKNNKKVIRVRPTIIKFIDGHDTIFTRFSIDSFLILNYRSFKINTISPIQELIFIDKFTDLILWDSGIGDGYSISLIEHIPSDTILLFEKTEYDIPIRIENNEKNCIYTILSNTRQTISESKVSFETQEAKMKYQKIDYV